MACKAYPFLYCSTVTMGGYANLAEVLTPYQSSEGLIDIQPSKKHHQQGKLGLKHLKPEYAYTPKPGNLSNRQKGLTHQHSTPYRPRQFFETSSQSILS